LKHRGGLATSTEASVSIGRCLTGSTRILLFLKKFLLRTRIRKKAFALGLFSGEFAGSSDRLIALPRRSFGRLLVEPSELHLPKDAFSLHFLFEDPKRLVDVVVANQYLQVMIPLFQSRQESKTIAGTPTVRFNVLSAISASGFTGDNRHGRWPSLASRGRSASAEKLDCDLRGHLFQGPPDFLGGVCQPVRVDVNSDAAARAAHVGGLLKALDRLLKLVPALRALEFDQMRVTHGAAQ
jgi:hypothetical protein